MDENLMPIGALWDPQVREEIDRKTSGYRRSGNKVDKEGYLQDIEGVYHAIGGFARLAHTANEDPKWFFNRFGDRLLPNVKEEHDVNITILPALPRSPLDGDYEVLDGQPVRDLSAVRGGDDQPPHSRGLRGPLDSRGDQAPWSAAQGTPRAGGSEDSRIQDSESLPFAEPYDP